MWSLIVVKITVLHVLHCNTINKTNWIKLCCAHNHFKRSNIELMQSAIAQHHATQVHMSVKSQSGAEWDPLGLPGKCSFCIWSLSKQAWTVEVGPWSGGPHGIALMLIGLLGQSTLDQLVDWVSSSRTEEGNIFVSSMAHASPHTYISSNLGNPLVVRWGNWPHATCKEGEEPNHSPTHLTLPLISDHCQFIQIHNKLA